MLDSNHPANTFVMAEGREYRNRRPLGRQPPMNRDHFLRLVLTGLFLPNVATNSAAAPPKIPSTLAKKNARVSAVRSYLQSRDARKWPETYQLLSPVTQRMISLEFFRQAKELPTDPTADGMTPILTAVSVLFVDAHNTLGYRYTVVGSAPDDPNVVLVDAQPPAVVSKAKLHLKIVTVGSPSATGQPRIDLMKSMQHSDPTGFKSMKQWAENRAKP
jgi:hypothetical protein